LKVQKYINSKILGIKSMKRVDRHFVTVEQLVKPGGKSCVYLYLDEHKFQFFIQKNEIFFFIFSYF